VARSLADQYLRVDARSLGLFRIAFALALLGDLFQRWRWLSAFYCNEGVLPNHNHLFQLREQGGVWSLYHAFSSPEENHVAFTVTLVIYLCFLLGFHTRVFHLLALVCLVGLAGRNVLLEHPGVTVGIALGAFSALLPLGAGLSIDSLRASFAEESERGPDELNAALPPPAATRASLAALVLVVVVGAIHLFAGLSHRGASWSDGSALYYALHVDRWASGIGVMLRGLPPALLAAWTKLLWVSELAVLPLVLIPVARRWVRAAAIALTVFHGLTFALLFDFGLYGWALAASAALLVPTETWEALKAKRPLTVYYDDDCGICLWSARLLRRMDLRRNIRFAAASDVDSYPKGVTKKLTDRSIVVIDKSGKVYDDERALSQIFRALPLLTPIGWLLRLPVLSLVARWLYRRVADNRLEISQACGMGMCGITPPDGDDLSADDVRGSSKAYRTLHRRRRLDTAIMSPDAPARRVGGGLAAVFASLAALAMLLVLLAQTEVAAPAGFPLATGLGRVRVLTEAARWTQLSATWGAWAPEPPRDNSNLVVDAETRSGENVDVLTGGVPDLELSNPALARNGVLWAYYGDRIRQDDYERFRQEFRRYLSRGGSKLDRGDTKNYVARFTVYWVSAPIPAPGTPRGEPTRQEILSQGARGRTIGDRSIPRIMDR
jgi:predicted DCC family thiol-disulfide oxidoreductase YuxK